MSGIRDRLARFFADESAHSSVEWMILGIVALGVLAVVIVHIGLIGFCIAWDVAG